MDSGRTDFSICYHICFGQLYSQSDKFNRMFRHFFANQRNCIEHAFSNYYCGRSDYFLPGRKRGSDCEFRNRLFMDSRKSDHTIYHFNYFGKLYRQGYCFRRLLGYFKPGKCNGNHQSYCDYYCRRTNHYMPGRARYADCQSGNSIFMDTGKPDYAIC